MEKKHPQTRFNPASKPGLEESRGWRSWDGIFQSRITTDMNFQHLSTPSWAVENLLHGSSFSPSPIDSQNDSQDWAKSTGDTPSAPEKKTIINPNRTLTTMTDLLLFVLFPDPFGLKAPQKTLPHKNKNDLCSRTSHSVVNLKTSFTGRYLFYDRFTLVTAHGTQPRNHSHAAPLMYCI